MPIRTVVWSTGGVGAIAIDAIARRPDLELVGVWVHSPDKVGKDAGELAGGEPLGVVATNDADALIVLAPDCVVYAASGPERDGAAVPDYLRLLGAGINVVSTSSTSLVYPPSYFAPDWRDELEAAAKSGGASFYVSGIFPGFASDQLALLMTTQSKSIRRITASEVALNDHYPVADVMMDGMGFGRPLDFEPMLKTPGFIEMAWKAPIYLIADGLGVEVEQVRGSLDRELTASRHRGGVRHHQGGHLRCGAHPGRGGGQRAGSHRHRARDPNGARCRAGLADLGLRRDLSSRHRRRSRHPLRDDARRGRGPRRRARRNGVDSHARRERDSRTSSKPPPGCSAR